MIDFGRNYSMTMEGNLVRSAQSLRVWCDKVAARSSCHDGGDLGPCAPRNQGSSPP
jgi:hypothetical protein